MTVHAAFPTQTERAANIARPHVVPLSASRSAVFFDTCPETATTDVRLSAMLGDRPVEGPVVVTRLGLVNGGVRHVAILSYPADVFCRSTLTFGSRDAILAATDPGALQSPLVDFISLLAGLDRPGSLRLLRLLLTTGASLFGNGAIGDFGALVDQLVERLGTKLPLRARSMVGRSATVLTWQLPGELELTPLRDLTLCADGRTFRVTEFTALEEVVEGCRLLHLLVERPLPTQAEFLALGGTLLRLGLSRDVAPRPLVNWLVPRTAEVRAAAFDFVDRLSRVHPEV